MTVSRAFEALASRRTTIGIMATFCVLTSAGLFVPQGVPASTITASYSTSLSQLIVAMGIHNVMSSWAMQLLSVALVVHLLAVLIQGWMTGPVERVSASRFVWVTAQALRSSGAHPEAFLRKALPDWRIRSLGPKRAVATRGVGFVGFLLLVLGFCLLVSSWILHGWLDTKGRVQLVTGPLDDSATTGWYSAELHDGDRYRQWDIGFKLACEQAVGSDWNGTRKCAVTREGQTSTVDLIPGRDLQIEAHRLTLIGMDRDANVGGFEVIASLDGVVQRSTASIGTPIPVISNGKEIATLLVSGLSAVDPVAVVPAPGVSRERVESITVSVQPRARLTFSVATNRFHWVTLGGGCLVVLGLLMALLFPGYRVYVVGDGDERCDVSIRWNGGLARPTQVLSQIHQQLGTEH